MMTIERMENEEHVMPEVADVRHPDHAIAPLILNRWSPRAMSGKPIADEELFALFEAARWAPSSGNGQPWRFIVARRQDEARFATFLDLLDEGNRAWCIRASALMVILSDTMSGWKGAFLGTHAFSTGSAWENLALEGTRRGLVVHGMGGFDQDAAREKLKVPEDHAIHAMCAIGKRAEASVLSEKDQAREVPSGRKPLSELVFDGEFGKPVNGLL